MIEVLVVLWAQTTPSGVAEVGSFFAGYGSLGVVTYLWLSDKIKTGKDYSQVVSERNEAWNQQKELYERVLPVLVAANELLTTLTKRASDEEQRAG